MWRLVLNTFLCLMIVLTGGGVYAFGLFSQAMKDQMNYSTLGTQFVYNFGLLGYSFACLLTGTFLSRFGYPVTFIVALLTSPSGYVLAALAIDGNFDCPDKLMWLLMFLAAFGQGLLFNAGLVTNTRNFPLRMRGKIIGVTMGLFALSPLFFSNIWRNCFVDDSESTKGDSQHVADYFKFLAVFTACSSFAGIVCVRRWDADDNIADAKDEFADDKLGDDECGLQITRRSTSGACAAAGADNTNDSRSVQTKEAPRSSDYSPMAALTSTSFLAILFMYGVFKGVDKTYLGDLGKIGQSLDKSSIVPNHLMVSGGTSFGARIVSGFALDMFRDKVPAWVFLEVGLSIILFVDILLVFFLDFMFETYLATVGHASAAIVYAVTPALIANRFGKDNMANLWALCLAISTTMTFAYGGWNSVFYNIACVGDATTCYGDECFCSAFSVSAGTMVLAMIILAWKGRDSQHSAAHERWLTARDSPSKL